MTFRLSPVRWPALTLASPVVAPWLFIRNRRFQKERAQSAEPNQVRIGHAERLELLELDYLELTVPVE